MKGEAGACGQYPAIEQAARCGRLQKSLGTVPLAQGQEGVGTGEKEQLGTWRQGRARQVRTQPCERIDCVIGAGLRGVYIRGLQLTVPRNKQ